MKNPRPFRLHRSVADLTSRAGESRIRCCDEPSTGGLAARDLDVLFQVRLGLSGLHAPVSPGVLAVSSRIVMNNVG
ncbi:MAG: hypothetical protein P0120_07405 [Nitrospira sp.]|nr:hypothetical protein [Nitrospira sp.]